ncbi:sulfotransferase family protein [Thermostaphylospora chromogena]|uniref:Sulfotransferase family protein n=1 Tax=Thermostaphylospora chromogena TaxID=35622 RepID=A0A1H1HJV2_9ACTN|nr:sulfotransferase [Thermostaphylospora chromogena]SDR25661.1 Sulfotransferase family protein [Thermostaphylospora chromogena]
MRPPPHILVVNGIKVRRPVFVVSAPHSGAELVARALKRSPGFHITMGRAEVDHVVHAFARRPSIATKNGGAGATSVLRDALARSWQITPEACTDCNESCREAGGVTDLGPCVMPGRVTTFGDASPDLLYSAPLLLRAFPDARFIQLIRDGRDVAAAMLADPACLAWFRSAMESEETEFPNPFLGVSRSEHRLRWERMPVAGKCALRWRNAVRLNAALRHELGPDQLLTLRYEELVASPEEAAQTLSGFLGMRVSRVALITANAPPVGAWRTLLRNQDLRLVEKVAREELRRLNYPPVSCP